MELFAAGFIQTIAGPETNREWVVWLTAINPYLGAM
jgi:hypothetical protein